MDMSQCDNKRSLSFAVGYQHIEGDADIMIGNKKQKCEEAKKRKRE